MCWMLYGYYVMFMCGGQNSWFCKASLRICYISLSECEDLMQFTLLCLKLLNHCLWMCDYNILITF